MMRRAAVAVVAGLAILCLSPAASPAQAPAQGEIDKAIAKGAEFLVQKCQGTITPDNWEYELVVYTMIHAELNPKKVPFLSKGIDDLLSRQYPITDTQQAADARMTYRMAVRALALHSLLL